MMKLSSRNPKREKLPCNSGGRSFCGMFVLVIQLLLSAISLTQQAPVPDTPLSTALPAYLLSPGDLIEVKFDYNPDLNEKIIIRPDGAISLPMIGELVVQNLTSADVSRTISERYAKYLAHPQTVVMVREFASQRVYVGGEVHAPTAMPLRGPLTALQAILHAGGANTSAQLDKVILIRYKGENAMQVRKINLKRVLKGEGTDVTLQPYDVLYVPRTSIAKIGLFVQQYVNDIVPKNLLFPYNINNTVSVRP